MANCWYSKQPKMPVVEVSCCYDDDYYLKLPLKSGRIAGIARLLDLRGDEDVCEIGCATGHFLAAIAPQVRTGTGIDISDAAIRAALQLKDQLDLHNIEFIKISATEYASDPDRQHRCHYVFLMDVTEHLDDDELHDVIDSSRALLRDDGRLVIHTPNLEYWLEQLKDKNILRQLEGHIAVRNQAQYDRLLNVCGFRIDRQENLPHYRQPMRFVDSVLLPVPFIGSRFSSRLFLVASKR